MSLERSEDLIKFNQRVKLGLKGMPEDRFKSTASKMYYQGPDFPVPTVISFYVQEVV